MIDLNEENFGDIISSTTGIAIVQFTADWCGPCRFIAPVLTELEEEGRLTYYKVDIEAQSELARDFQIMSIPTLFYYKDGVKKETTIGMQRKTQIEETIENL